MTSLCWTEQRYQAESSLSYEAYLTRNLKISLFPINIIISIFGIVANVLNLCVFCRQAVHDTITICFIALAVTDLLTVIGLLFLNLLAWNETKMWFSLLPGLIYPQGWIVVLTTGISMWTAVYISLQRSFSVAFPFKVKDFITKKVTTAVLIIIVMISVASVVPALCGLRFRLYWDTERNASLPCIDFTENGEFLVSISLAITSALNISASVILTVSTIVLVVGLKKKIKLRLRLGQADVEARSQSSGKENRIIKMVVVVSVIFLACYTPFVIYSFAFKLIPELDLTNGEVNEIRRLSLFLSFMFMNINASVNILVYYNMIAKYKFGLQRILYKSRVVD